jgi:hypothetical protein
VDTNVSAEHDASIPRVKRDNLRAFNFLLILLQSFVLEIKLIYILVFRVVTLYSL